MDDSIVTLIAAIVAAAAAIASALISWLSNRSTRRAVDRQRSEDYRIRQLNELYGPMHMLRRQSRSLWKQLPPEPDPEPGVTKWKLIDHIEEIWAEPDDRRRMVVTSILEINEKLSELIIEKGGLLVEFPAPDTFETFLNHATTLRQHWERKRNVTDETSHVPFPGDIDRDINNAIEALRKKL